MTFKLTDTHIDFSGDPGYPGRFNLMCGTVYTTNLMYYSWDSGELASLSIYCGPKGGYYFQFSDGSRRPYRPHDINYFSSSGSAVVFQSSKLAEFLPKFIKHTTTYIETHTRLLARGQARLTHLQQLANTHPEAFL